LILAGGLGTRLRSVVSDRQKVIADVSGRPFVTYLFDQLIAGGIRSAVLCTGYQGERVAEVFGHAYESLELRYSQETSPLGTGGALRLALPLIQSEWIVAMNGDSYCGVDLLDVWAWHARHSASASLVLVHQPDARGFGRVRCDESNRITSFEEKRDEPGSAWINAGIYILHRSLVESIPIDQPVSIERDIFPRWLDRGMYGYQARASFVDIGTPSSYTNAQAMMAETAR
jgi:D-glycero-alpha-D-manno-heptose 1-phosphate guanylyltransferase